MPFQAVPATAQVTIKNKLDGQDYVNGLYFRKIAGGIVSQQDLIGLGAGVANFIGSDLYTIWPAAMIHEKVVIRAIDVENSWVVENFTEAQTPGFRAGNILPNNVAFSVSFKTGLAGKTNSGRNSVGGLLETDVTGSLVSNVLANGIRDTYALMITPGYVAAGWEWVIVSRKVVNPGDPGVPRAVTAVAYSDLVIDSQRTRLPGRGN